MPRTRRGFTCFTSSAQTHTPRVRATCPDAATRFPSVAVVTNPCPSWNMVAYSSLFVAFYRQIRPSFGGHCHVWTIKSVSQTTSSPGSTCSFLHLPARGSFISTVFERRILPHELVLTLLVVLAQVFAALSVTYGVSLRQDASSVLTPMHAIAVTIAEGCVASFCLRAAFSDSPYHVGRITVSILEGSTDTSPFWTHSIISCVSCSTCLMMMVTTRHSGHVQQQKAVSRLCTHN